MNRPAVLLIEADRERRRAIAVGLARFAYELVPASSADEGLRFASGLGPSVVLAAAEIAGTGEGSLLESLRALDAGARRTLVLLGTPEDGADGLPEDVLPIAVEGRSNDEVVRRIRLVLVGREVGLAPDYALRNLLGDLAVTPLLEIARNLHAARVSGTLRIDDDDIVQFDRGEVTSARAGAARGVKAVCRLARRGEGSLRLSLGAPTVRRNVDRPFDELMVQAIEDAQVPLPPLGARVRLLDVDAEQGTESDPVLRASVGDGTTIGSLLDVLPMRDGEVARRIERLYARGVLSVEQDRPPVAIVTDSTGDLPASMVDNLGIHVVPLWVRFGDEKFRDGVDIRPRDFYQLIEGEAPSTEPPGIETIRAVYEPLADDREVVSIHISSAMSETFEQARAAAVAVQASRIDNPSVSGLRVGNRIEAVDGRGVSVGLGLQAVFAARLAKRGHSALEIVERVKAWRGRVSTLFVVDTFDYLVRGGRVGAARAAIGRMLGIKPILGVEDGRIVAVDRVRGGRRAHPRIVELVAARVDPEQPIVVAVAHAAAPTWADRLRGLLEARFTLAEFFQSDMGPVVGTHVGPGCVGCVVFQPTAEEWPEIGPLD